MDTHAVTPLVHAAKNMLRYSPAYLQREGLNENLISNWSSSYV
jgi:hypothetical protein